MEGEMDWVIQINEKLEQMVDTNKEMEQWKKRSIYKVPVSVTVLNKNAYTPQAVSFGPYHHGEGHLKQMEDHKNRALLHFLKRSNKPLKMFVYALAQVVQLLQDSYDSLDPIWYEPNRFLQLMILDGCFMLEILRTFTDITDIITNDYADNDPIFSDHGRLNIIPYIKRDMLMIENQLPMLLLEKLVAVESAGETNSKEEEFLKRLILKFYAPNATVPPNLVNCLHVLDVYRKSLLQEEAPRRKSRRRSTRLVIHESTGNTIPSATKLHEAGIRFKKSKDGGLKSISFHSGVLSLPVIMVDDTTESMFLNLMAFERFHVGTGNEVTSYICFMDNIIDDAKDVNLLNSMGIIQNAIGSDKAVAKLFNKLSKDVTLTPNSNFAKVHHKVNDYSRKSWNQWRANLIHTYFRNPWAILSLVAAIVLMALTVAQTVYTIYPYYTDNNTLAVSTVPSPAPN